MYCFLKILFVVLFSLPNSYAQETFGIRIDVPKAVEETCNQIMSRPVTNNQTIKPRPVYAVPALIIPSLEIKDIPQATLDETIDTVLDDTTYRSPQTVSLNFNSITFNDTFDLPPDSDGAIGPTQFLTVVNGRIRSHSRITGAADGVLNTTLDNFFASVINGSSTSDPRVKYDRVNGVWYITCITVAMPVNRILLAVSSTAILSNTTIWRFFFLDPTAVNPPGDAGLFLDFDTFGHDINALYVGGNQFNSSGFYTNSCLFVIQKASVLSGGPLVANAFRNLIGGGGPVTPQGADNYDAAPTHGFAIGNVNSTNFALRIISNPGSTTPSISGAILIPITQTAEPPSVPALGSTTPLDSIDDRLGEAHIRNNQLWVTHNIGVNSSGTSTGTIDRVGIRYYQYDLTIPTVPVLVQSGTLFDSSATNPTFYWIPSIMTSGQGHMALGFSVAGATQSANAGTVGRLSSYALGTLGAPTLLTASSSSYNVQSGGVQRWGDFSVTSIDPEDNMTMWTIQEWCNATNSYGCEVAQLLAPPPANVSSATPPIVSRGLTSVSVTIVGSAISGSGFYDPGTGFDKRLTVLVNGGVLVNSVTYVNPTTLIINFNTMFATSGLKTIIVKNPDGQQKSGSVLFVL